MQSEFGPRALERLRKIGPDTLKRLARSAIKLIGYSPRPESQRTPDLEPTTEISPVPAVSHIDQASESYRIPATKEVAPTYGGLTKPEVRSPSEVVIPNPIPVAPHILHNRRHGRAPEIPITSAKVEEWHRRQEPWHQEPQKAARDKELVNSH